MGALLADVGTLAPPRGRPDITREEVGAETGVDVAALGAAGDRGAAIAAMAGAAAALARRLYDEGRIHGVLSAGGSGNTAIATAAMQALPVGVPKLMVSTMAAGDTSDYVGGVDVTMMASVTDVAGINSISSRILANAAAAMAGMVLAPAPQLEGGRPLVAATMFGVTTPCVTRAREALEEKGYEVLVFHATGTGGKAMEALVDGGLRERRARRDDHGAVRRPRRRCAVGGSRAPGGRGARRRATGRLARRARHGQLRRARHRAARSSRTATSTSTTRRSR